jgi:L-asparaginase
MKKIMIISTGGTFNKVYNPQNGELQIDKTAHALYSIAKEWLYTFDVSTIIGKDSLEMTQDDRTLLLEHILALNYQHIIIIHGTDTMDITAHYLAQQNLDKTIVLTGAMIPYSIHPTEATANLSAAYGYLSALAEKGVFIVMNGSMGRYDTVIKDRLLGRFIRKVQL